MTGVCVPRQSFSPYTFAVIYGQDAHSRPTLDVIPAKAGIHPRQRE